MICDFYSRNLANLISTAKMVFAKIAFFCFAKSYFSNCMKRKVFFFMRLDAKLKKSFLMKKTAFFLFQICSCILASSFILDCYFAEYITFWWKTHTEKKRKCVSATHEKKKMKTALHDSFVIYPFFLFLFPVRIRKVQLLQIKHVGVIIVLELFQKRKTPWIYLQCTNFKKKNKKRFPILPWQNCKHVVEFNQKYALQN